MVISDAYNTHLTQINIQIPSPQKKYRGDQRAKRDKYTQENEQNSLNYTK